MATNFSTIGGQVTRGECFSKLLYHMDELRDQCLVMAHLYQTEDTTKDSTLATGWRGIEELLHRMRTQMTKLAQGTIQ
jgi:hypothetical protein